MGLVLERTLGQRSAFAKAIHIFIVGLGPFTRLRNILGMIVGFFAIPSIAVFSTVAEEIIPAKPRPPWRAGILAHHLGPAPAHHRSHQSILSASFLHSTKATPI